MDFFEPTPHLIHLYPIN